MRLRALEVLKVCLPREQWTVLRLRTEEGICGWGEITGSCDDDAVAALLTRITPELARRDLLNILDCRALLTGWRYPAVRTVRSVATALSGLDQALWDITARWYRTPLYKLYGAAGVDSVPLYANLNKALWGMRSPHALMENGSAAAAAGFSTVKCTPFDEVVPTGMDVSLERGLERIEALTQAVPMGRVAVDCHQRFEGYTLARMLEQVVGRWGLPYWVEDPVPVQQDAALRRAQAAFPGIRWAAGEDSLCGRQMMEVVRQGCYEVLMPDVKYIGGPSTVRALLPVLEELGVKPTLHNPSGPIATAHSAHLSALIGCGAPMEFPFGVTDGRAQMCAPYEPIQDGRYWLSERPGIGITLSEDALRTYAQKFCDGVWKRYAGETA